MLEFFKRFRKKKMSDGDVDLKATVESYAEPEVEILSEETVSAKDANPPKYIIKEDAKIMSIPCDHKNILPQSVLMIDKTLITDPNDVDVYINLSHLNSVDTLEEGVKEVIDIKDPCGGTGTIKGEVLLEKVILVGGVHYSILLYDKTTQTKVYDGDVQFLTAYSLISIVPFYTEVEVDPTKVVANFVNVVLTKLEDIPGVDYYLYTVDGEVELDVLP